MDITRILGVREFPELLKRISDGNITEIAGFTRDQLLQFKDLYPATFETEMRNAILKRATMETGLAKPTVGNYSKFLSMTDEVLADSMKTATGEQLAWITNTFKQYKLGRAATRLLPKLGVGFALMGGLVVSAQAADAYADGKPDEAKQILEEYAADSAGSAFASKVAGALATAGLALLVLAGGTVSAPVAAAVVLLATATGGFFGGDWGKELLYMFQDHSEEKKRDLARRMLKLVFGEDYSLDTPIPQELLASKSLTLNSKFTQEVIVAKAQTDIAWRYALRELNPFVISGDMLYDKHNTDGSLDLYDSATDQGTMTEQYLLDRAAMLMWKLRYDKENKPYVAEYNTFSVSGNWDFVDLATKISGDPLTLRIDGIGISLSDHQVVFGGKDNDIINGSGDSDNLYGGSGNDSIDGGKENDYLEGNVGEDTLHGGEGNDELLGGEGIDIIYGDKGNDTLRGGADADIYRFKAGDGWDTIIDKDVFGAIEIDNITLDGGKETSTGSGVWISADKKFQYSIIPGADGKKTLIISSGTDRIYVKDFSEDDLGISLEDGTPTAATPTNRTIVGDLSPVDFDPATAGIQTQIDQLGNIISSGDEPGRADTLYGSDDADLIQGVGGEDVLFGKSGDDSMEGGAGRDRVFGNDGKDILLGGADTDILVGGADDDYVSSDSKVEAAQAIEQGHTQEATDQKGDWLNGGAGDDTLVAGANNDVLAGGGGTDLLIGGAGDDDIFGDIDWVAQSFDWTVTNGSGNRLYEPVSGEEQPLDGAGDVIYAGNGADHVWSGIGDDVIYGEDGNDVLKGNDGNDLILGGNGDDSMYGDGVSYAGQTSVAGGNDYLNGGAGNDVIFGQDKDDEIYGGDGNDTLLSDGDDVALADQGSDYLDGEAGDDQLKGHGGDDQLFGGDGADQLSGDEGNDYLDGEAGKDFLVGGSDADELYGGGGNDTLLGDGENVAAVDQGNDYLDGEEGDDQLKGYAGDDTLFGGMGDDTLQADAGNDYLDGETGDDLLDAGDGDDLLNGGDGEDELQGGAGNDVLNGGVDVDLLFGGEGDDTVNGGDGNDAIDAGEGNDVVFGDAGADQMWGSEGNDVLYGGLDDDQLIGDEGDDNLSGESGNDVLIGGVGADVLQGGEGNDILQGEDDQDTLSGGEGSDLLFGQNGNDILDGGAGNDSLVGGEGDDVLEGMGGTDVLWGQAGADSLSGGEGDDVLIGGEGNDTLNGGAGDDFLIGGAGDDVYILSGGGNDYIDDTQGNNTIDLGDGVTLNDLQVHAPNAGNAYYVVKTNAGQTLYIKNGGGSGNAPNFRLGGGTVVSSGQLFATAPSLPADMLENVLFGTQGNDYVTSSNKSGDYKLDGGNGDDTILGGAGNDTLIGGLGNDSLNGGDGSNTYLYGGEGDDIIANAQSGGSHILQFKHGILAGDVSYIHHASGDLIIALNNGSGSMNIKGFYNNNGSHLDQIIYGDGAVQGMAAIQAISQLPIMVDAEGNATGTVYNDIVHGDMAGNILDGGSGNDTLTGGAGTDIYVMSLGMGMDIIIEGVGELNILKLDAGLKFSQLEVIQEQNDLHLRIKGTNDAVVLKDYCIDENAQSWEVQDAIGEQKTLENLIAGTSAPYQTSAEFVQAKKESWLSGTKNAIFSALVLDTPWEKKGWIQVEPEKFWTSGEYADTFLTIATPNSGSNAAVLESMYSGSIDELLDTVTSTYTINVPVGQFGFSDGGNYGGVYYNHVLKDYRNLDSAGEATVIATMDTLDGFWEFIRYESIVYVQAGSSNSQWQNATATVPIEVAYSRPTYLTTWNIELITGDAGDNLIVPWGMNAINAGAGNDFITGDGWGWDDGDSEYGGNFLDGGSGNDTIFGSTDDDYLVGGSGNDYLTGNGRNDTYYILAQETGRTVINESTVTFKAKVQDTIVGEYWEGLILSERNYGYIDSVDTVEFSAGVSLDDLQFSLGQFNSDMVNGQGWNYSTLNMSWGTEKEVVIVLPDQSNPEMTQYGPQLLSPDATWGIEFFKFADGTTITMAEMMAIALTQPGMALDTHIVGDESNNNLTGSASNDLIQGYEGNDLLNGLSGNDKLEGGAGNDTIFGNEGNDTLHGGSGSDYLMGHEGNDTYYFAKGSGNDSLVYDYDQTIGNVDTIVFGPDISPDSVSFVKTPYALKVSFNGGADQFKIAWFYEETSRIERFVFGDGTVWDAAEVENHLTTQIVATEYADVISGTAQDDVIDGLGGGDEIYGNDGNDVLFGGGGDDYMEGGAGVDVLYGGSDNDDIEDWEGNNLLSGGVGDDYLYGDDAANFLIGGQGNDFNDTWAAHSVIAFNAGDGADTIYGGNAFTLSLGGILGQDLAISFDELVSGFSNSLLIDAGAVDSICLAHFFNDEPANRPSITLQIIGSDVRTYDLNAVIADFEAAIAQGASGSNWSIAASLNSHLLSVSTDQAIGGKLAYRYANDGHLESLTSEEIRAVLSNPDFGVAAQVVQGGDVPDIVVGTDAGDQLNGTDGIDTLAGGAGNDVLDGGLGDDTYLFNAGDGIDTILDGDGIDTIQFGDGITEDSLSLGIGSLLVRYGDGQDAIHIEGFNPAEALGTSTIENFVFADGSSLTYAQLLARGFDLAGSGTIAGTSVNDRITGSEVADVISASYGNDLLLGLAGNDQLLGDAGDDTLDGGLGTDAMTGGAGNDTYIVDTSWDVVAENAGEGIDHVFSNANSYRMSANIENLTLVGTEAIFAGGNDLNNILTGNAANNSLFGGAGADSMIGAAGDDIYYVDSAGDVVNEYVGEGIDLVDASITYVLDDNVEVLALSGAALDGTGNAANNLIKGNSYNNLLNGLNGYDLLQGGAGNDTLTDNSGNNLFDGGFGLDTLNGGGGSEFMAGGAGNDAITTGAGADVIAFNRGNGMDVVNASTGLDNTLSLGKGIKYADLLFKKSTNDLILVTGTNEQVTFKDWYADANYRSVANLQVVIEGTSDYVAGSSSLINDNKIERFNFDALVTKFDQAMVADPSLSSWTLSSSLLEFHLGGSDTAAIGGDLAYQYAKNGNLSSLSMTPAQALLADSAFGANAQNLQSTTALQDLSPRLS